MNRKICFLLIGFIILLSGCSRFNVKNPEGFASENTKGIHYSFSPEGVKIKIRRFANKPSMDNVFWAESLQKHLEGKGYRLVEKIVSSEGAEKCIKYYWLMPYGNEYYIYMTAVLSNKKSIVIAEAAGKRHEFERYRDVIDSSVKSIELN